MVRYHAWHLVSHRDICAIAHVAIFFCAGTIPVLKKAIREWRDKRKSCVWVLINSRNRSGSCSENCGFVLLNSWDAIPRMEFCIPRMECRIPRAAPRIPRNSPRAPRMAFALRECFSWNWGGPQASETYHAIIVRYSMKTSTNMQYYRYKYENYRCRASRAQGWWWWWRWRFAWCWYRDIAGGHGKALLLPRVCVPLKHHLRRTTFPERNVFEFRMLTKSAPNFPHILGPFWLRASNIPQISRQMPHPELPGKVTERITGEPLQGVTALGKSRGPPRRSPESPAEPSRRPSQRPLRTSLRGNFPRKQSDPLPGTSEAETMLKSACEIPRWPRAVAYFTA